MTIIFPALRPDRNETIPGVWDFVTGLKKNDVNVINEDENFDVSLPEDIDHKWNFVLMHSSGVLKDDSNILTSSDRRSSYQLSGQSNATLTLGSATLQEMKTATGIWEFKVMNWTNPAAVFTVDVETISGADIVNSGGFAKIDTSAFFSLGNPFSPFSQVHISGSSVGSYNGDQTVAGIDAEFAILDVAYNGDATASLSPNIVSIQGGINHQSRIYTSGSGETFWCDGVNWMYF